MMMMMMTMTMTTMMTMMTMMMVFVTSQVCCQKETSYNITCILEKALVIILLIWEIYDFWAVFSLNKRNGSVLGIVPLYAFWSQKWNKRKHSRPSRHKCALLVQVSVKCPNEHKSKQKLLWAENLPIESRYIYTYIYILSYSRRNHHHVHLCSPGEKRPHQLGESLSAQDSTSGRPGRPVTAGHRSRCRVNSAMKNRVQPWLFWSVGFMDIKGHQNLSDVSITYNAARDL